MKWTSVDDLREQFLTFFEKKNHIRCGSFSLVPEDDKSLLLVNSGMGPLKKYFLGQKKCATNRMTSSQKCIRTPDIDRVGITSRHGTFFEMLGSFSFGDYFKKDAIAWAFEFVSETIKMPLEKLFITVYEDDEEAYNIWVDEIKIPKSHMVKLGKADNFWEIGAGPCGPCTELYFDRGEVYGCGQEDCKPGCDCDRFVEFWNIVFSEFNSDGKGNYKELAHKNIDTGMGLERLACIVQGVDNLFEVDSVKKVIAAVCKKTGGSYNSSEKDDISIRVIADHIRSSVFMISDQVMPSNDGRGYVLRRLIRRAVKHGRRLGLTDPFLFELCDEVIKGSRSAYPELEQNRKHIEDVIKNEEEKFGETLDQGLELLSNIISSLKSKVLPGELAFKLYDTFGFPLEIIEEITAEAGIQVDRLGFDELMKKQRQTARDARKKTGDAGWKPGDVDLFEEVATSLFVGYSQLCVKTKILALAKEGARVKEVTLGDVCTLVVAQTPFYSTSGGQVYDTGSIECKNGRLEVTNSQKLPTGQVILTASVREGNLGVDEEVECRVDPERRQAICKNHSACHILQKALREILGEHVTQAGSYVDDKRLRFDFAHFKALSREQLAATQQKVNEVIFSGQPVSVKEMPIEEAKKTGAIALFGEKYTNDVRVCSIGDYSIEFCGGTHVSNTSQINIFKIISESSVAAGIRRIEATTSAGVLAIVEQSDELLCKIAESLKVTSIGEIEKRLGLTLEELANANFEIKKLRNQRIEAMVVLQAKNAKQLNGLSVVVQVFDDLKPEELRPLCDKLKLRLVDSVVVLVAPGERNAVLVSVTGKARERYEAVDIVKGVCAALGGGGGGKKELAQGNILKIQGLEEEVLRILQG
ncbi:MAG: alanine--tRNA ligase [Oscillospiraceae bacterium]|jgi:alanyl-tRNA synthetase|nr:alanine--tRNA ligase [Oscillospiraceae bacterium]